METRKKQLLLVEDDKIDQMAFKRFASKNNFPYGFDISGSVTAAKKILKSKKYDVIVSDFSLGDGTAFDLLKYIKDTPVIITTGLGNERVAVEAMKLGAYDYLIKDMEGLYFNLLPITVSNTIKRFEAEQKLKEYHKNLEVLVSERTAELQLEIAERKKAQEILSSSEERLKILFDYAPDAYYLSDLKGTLIDANKAVEDLTGHKREEIIGANILDLELIPTDQLAKINKSIKRGELGRKLGPVELILNHNDGHEIYVEVTTFSVKIDNKVVLLGIAHDISDRKKADKALRESENRYRLITTNTLDTIWTTDKELNITFVNNAIYNFMGYTPEEFANLKLDVYTTPNGLSTIKKVSEQLIANYKSGKISEIKFELQQIKKNGTLMDVEVSANILVDNDKKFIGFQGRSVDISERKVAERRLNEFVDIVNRSPSVVFLWKNSKNWPVEYVSENVEKLTGYTAQEFLAEEITYKQIIYTDDREKIENETANFLRKNSGNILEQKNYRIITKNGCIKWVEDRTVVRKDTGGNIIAYEGIVSDITNRKKNEELITKLLSAVEQSPSVIVITDLNGNIEYANPSFINQTGYSSEEVIGKNPRILKSGEMADKIYEELWETITSGKEWRGEFHNKKKNGELFWEAASILPIVDGEGKTINYLKVAKDITEAKEKDEKLQYSEEQFRAVVEHSPNGISILGENYMFNYVNDRLCEIFGRKREEIVGHDFREFLDEESGKFVGEIYLKRRKHDVVPDTYECNVVRSEGDIRRIEISSAIVKDLNNSLRTISQIVDITDRKRAEAALKTALIKATESDRLKSAFLATMSHELRTPLNAIIGFSDLIDRSLPIDDILKYSEIINSSGEHLLSIVNDLFDISLIESGEINMIEKEVVLHTVLNNVYEIVKAKQQRDGKDNVEINMVIPVENRELTVVTDETKLSQILINLIKNSLKFTQRGHIKFGYNIETKKDGSTLIFFVEDTGIGIEKDKHEVIFEIFRQGEDSLNREYGGTGIGLSISKKLVELMKGEIWVESELGAGSTFYFTIPLNGFIKKNPKAKDSMTKEKPGEGRTILIVEDDEMSFEYLVSVLNVLNINVIRARNGEESVALCKENTNIDLILMDINMPIMDGYTATKEIKEFRPKLPIIAQTAHAIAGDYEKAIDAGCDDYISKPIKKEDLLKKIDFFMNPGV